MFQWIFSNLHEENNPSQPDWFYVWLFPFHFPTDTCPPMSSLCAGIIISVSLPPNMCQPLYFMWNMERGCLFRRFSFFLRYDSCLFSWFQRGAFKKLPFSLPGHSLLLSTSALILILSGHLEIFPFLLPSLDCVFHAVWRPFILMVFERPAF